MTRIDLFSGIGGFAYAAQQVWPDYRNLFFCDNNKFCQAVIRKNFGADSLIYSDIREVTVERFTQDSIDLLTGGFPCQPFSVAGKREGRDDDRHLWPEMFRVIRDCKPTWVIAENVRGLLTIEGGMAFEQVCLDLESIGYTVQAFIIPACAVNAPHRRDRVWIVANSEIERSVGGSQAVRGTKQRQVNELLPQPNDADRHAADAKAKGLEGRNAERPGSADGRITEHAFCEFWDNEGRPKWETNWLTVATATCVRGIYDGLPAELDELKLSKSKHREERLKSLGNAIVPQVAIEIMRAIKNSDLE